MKSLPLNITPAVQERRIAILKALAHPSRLLMVEALAEEALCVGELHQLAGGDLSTVSKHLAVLRNAELVRDERRGAKIFYQLTAPCILKLFECLETARKTTCQPPTP